jgi:AcrR family transcriptional regulator
MTEVLTDEGVTPETTRGGRAPVQRRGQARVEAILDAAEAVFGEMGVESATTNAIAERAGASVGSMYHFFPNKAAILEALAERYSATVRAMVREGLRADDPTLELRVMFTQMVRSFEQMNDLHPGYLAVCRATDTMSGGKSQIALQMEAALENMVTDLLLVRCPGIPVEEARTHAAISCVTMHANLDHIDSVPEHRRPALQAALVEMMVRYLTPIEDVYPRR